MGSVVRLGGSFRGQCFRASFVAAVFAISVFGHCLRLVFAERFLRLAFPGSVVDQCFRPVFPGSIFGHWLGAGFAASVFGHPLRRRFSISVFGFVCV